MREAFGIKYVASARPGWSRRKARPFGTYVKACFAAVTREMDSDFAEKSHDLSAASKVRKPTPTTSSERPVSNCPRHFAVAAVSLRQAWREIARNYRTIRYSIQVEETPEGLHIQLVDQEGRSMFPARRQSTPYERTPKKLLAKMAPGA